MFDKLHEECGVVAIYGHPEASKLAYLGLYSLQHRGQEAAGIAVFDAEHKVRLHKDMGLVSQVVEGKQLMPALRELAGQYAQVGPLASLGAKAVARTRMTQGFGPARLLSDHLRRSFEFTHDADEGMQAHLSGRKPDFTGH